MARLLNYEHKILMEKYMHYAIIDSLQEFEGRTDKNKNTAIFILTIGTGPGHPRQE